MYILRSTGSIGTDERRKTQGQTLSAATPLGRRDIFLLYVAVVSFRTAPPPFLSEGVRGTASK